MASNSSRNHSAPVWGIFLLFLGVVFLLQTAGVLPWALWQTLGGLWPVLIIVVGLAILLRHFNVWLVSLLIAVIFGGTLALAIGQYNALPIGALTNVYTQPVSGVSQAAVNLELDASNITVESLTADSANLVEVSSTFTLSNAKDALDANLDRNGSQAIIYISVKPAGVSTGNIRWVVKVAQKIPLNLTLKSNASNAKLTLSDLTLSALQLEGNASNIDADLPVPTGSVISTIKANASNMDVTVPTNVLARFSTTSNLSAVDISSRFPKQGDYYISSGFDAAANRYTISIDANVSRVQVR